MSIIILLVFVVIAVNTFFAPLSKESAGTSPARCPLCNQVKSENDHDHKSHV